MTTALLLPLLLAGQPVFEDLAALDAQLAKASDHRALPVDRRLRLARCPAPITLGPGQHGTIIVRCSEIGWQLHVPLAQQGSAGAADTVSPILIQRGESVQVAIKGDEFTLTYQAVATEAGRRGDPVRVKFSPSGKVLVATVSGKGKVEILD